MLRPTEEELRVLEQEYKERNKWLPEDDPLGYILKYEVNEYAYNVLKDKLPEVLIKVLKDNNIYKYNDTAAIGYVSHLLSGYIQITEDRIKELEDRVAKLENMISLGK